MRLQIVVDWLNYTADRPIDVRPLDHIYPTEGKLTDEKAVHGYTNAVSNIMGARAMWHIARHDMGIHIQYSGSALNKYLSSGVDARAIALFHSDARHRCSRIDVAIDVLDSNLNIAALYELIQTKRYVLPFKRKAALLTSTDGVTMYIGSRTSDIFMRVYDKGREQKTDDNWKRIELELKGTRAMFFVNLLVQEGQQSAGETARRVIAGMAMFDDPTWMAIITDEPMIVGKGKASDKDTKTWLITQVAPAMGRYIAKSGDSAVVEQFWAVVAAFSGETLDKENVARQQS